MQSSNNFRNGSTPFDNLNISIRFNDGIATTEDARLGFPETGRGILPSGGGTMKLADQIGYARAMTGKNEPVDMNTAPLELISPANMPLRTPKINMANPGGMP